MTGEELDKRMREILMNATLETGLASIKALMELGFGRGPSLKIISDILVAKEEGRYPHAAKDQKA